VSLAGPAANIILAVALGYAYRGLSAWVGESPLYPYDVLFLRLSVLINIGLSFFNLIPIPPLDGSKIFMGLIPPARVASYINIVRHVPKIFLLLILVEWGFHVPVLSWLLDPLWNPYLAFWQFVIFGGKVM
jgi:Zn-dependent protease